MPRQRRTWGANKTARVPTGLYGYTKKTQGDCEAAVRKINKHAAALIRVAYRKDERVLAFLETHANRAASNPARVLLASWGNLGKRASELVGGKTAAGRSYSLYGYPRKTVKIGLAICSQLREETGSVASILHARRVARYAKITGFFTDHIKQAQCNTSRMLLAGYPDENSRYAMVTEKTACGSDGDCGCGCGGKGKGDKKESPEPSSVDDWLSWDMDELEAS